MAEMLLITLPTSNKKIVHKVLDAFGDLKHVEVKEYVETKLHVQDEVGHSDPYGGNIDDDSNDLKVCDQHCEGRESIGLGPGVLLIGLMGLGEFQDQIDE